jgi:DNA polymerase-3 subunit delta'
MVGTDARLPLPWLAAPLRQGLGQSAHAILLHGPEGVGQFELALALAQAWLCEAPAAATPMERRPCGVCASCRLVQAHSHPDLLVLVPEALAEMLGWNTGDGEEGAERKTKPSKEIKVEAVRAAVAYAQTTTARGRAKVVVLHPAERINPIASNTLLKTLEEPPGDARFILSCAAPDALLPTIRSRCQTLALGLPTTAEAAGWLKERGVADPAVLLAGCGGQPLQALQWAEDGVDARLWTQVPALVSRGEAMPFLGWPLPRLVEALQKLCHDALCVACGVAPRYFPAIAVKTGASVATLTEWAKSLGRTAQHAEHPWLPGLMVEALIDEGRASLTARGPGGGRGRGNSVHSGA